MRVPFVSEQLLVAGIEGRGWRLFGTSQGYRLPQTQDKLVREASSTIVWETLASHSTLPLIWNALPFHPHKPDDIWSNRTPKTAELALGRPFLLDLLTLFPIQQLVAVGNKAAESLGRWGQTAVKVRHPSHGGKRAFTQQLHDCLVNH
ncbi:MAG: uracil-DNA glycosylase [Chloroflexota bacterium]